MVGLQGSGKTTTAAKLARLAQARRQKAAACGGRFAAARGRRTTSGLGQQIDVPVFSLPGETPVNVCRSAPAYAKKAGCDVIVYDTAGVLLSTNH